MKYLSLFALVALGLKQVSAAHGVDFSTALSVDTLSCIRNNGIDFAIPRAWCSYGGMDWNGPNNVNNARAAGIPYVDVYMFPCVGKSATD